MQQNLLGGSGLLTADLGLGTMVFGDEGARGTPTDESEGRIAVMADDADERGASYAQVVALAWLRAQPVVSSVIIGVRTMAQLADNLKAAELNLTTDELALLDEASALPEVYPYRFQQNYMRQLPK